MKTAIFCLFVIFSFNYQSFAYPTENINSILGSDGSNAATSANAKPIPIIETSGHQQNSRIGERHDKIIEDEAEQNENGLVRRFRRCADWFRRIRSRYSGPNGINLFGPNGLFGSLNEGYRYSNRYNDLNTHHDNQPSYESYDENSNYQPANDNHELSRINNSPSTYHIPSTSSAPVFVEASSFETPPKREEAPAVSSEAPVEHSNDDWTHSPNE